MFLIHEDEAFTTQAAADFLGISRQFLVRLLDEGNLTCRRVGTHRRVFLKDLALYQRQRSQDRRAVLDKMTADVVAAGLDDRYVKLARPDEG
jgi:excisionase family DNA binding protein